MDTEQGMLAGEYYRTSEQITLFCGQTYYHATEVQNHTA